MRFTTVSGYLNKEQVMARLEKCSKEKLCYISLKPLEEDWGWLDLKGYCLIQVKSKYAEKVVDKNPTK